MIRDTGWLEVNEDSDERLTIHGNDFTAYISRFAVNDWQIDVESDDGAGTYGTVRSKKEALLYVFEKAGIIEERWNTWRKTMVGNNLPPGASSDPRAPYNQPDRSHEHIWRHEEEQLQPVIEDGAAIFYEECQYAEGRYGDGWQCEETRTYRFEYSTLETPRGDKYDLPAIGNWDEADPVAAEAAVKVEQAFHSLGPGDKVSFDVDPDPECGVVTIEWNGYTLKFEP